LPSPVGVPALLRATPFNPLERCGIFRIRPELEASNDAPCDSACVVLHRSKPALKIRLFLNFRCCELVAERVGLSSPIPQIRENRRKTRIPKKPVEFCEHRCVPPGRRIRALISADFGASCGSLFRTLGSESGAHFGRGLPSITSTTSSAHLSKRDLATRPAGASQGPVADIAGEITQTTTGGTSGAPIRAGRDYPGP